MKCKFCKSKNIDYFAKRFEDKKHKIYLGRIYLCFNCGRLSYKEKK